MRKGLSASAKRSEQDLLTPSEHTLCLLHRILPVLKLELSHDLMSCFLSQLQYPALNEVDRLRDLLASVHPLTLDGKALRQDTDAVEMDVKKHA